MLAGVPAPRQNFSTVTVSQTEKKKQRIFLVTGGF